MKRWWRALRTVTGDDAYERYLERHRRCPSHGGEAPLSRRDFFADALRRRWHGVKRCC